jgi:hypothetical protein
MEPENALRVQKITTLDHSLKINNILETRNTKDNDMPVNTNSSFI